MSNSFEERVAVSFGIGELAKHTGCKVPTIRFYEQKGLLHEPERSEGGQRRYNTAALQRLRFICHARQLGFSLASTRELLELTESSNTSPHADQLVAVQLDDVKAKIKRLRSLQRELERMLERCDSGDHECGVIDALANHALCASDHH